MISYLSMIVEQLDMGYLEFDQHSHVVLSYKYSDKFFNMFLFVQLCSCMCVITSVK